jgi:outer membrane protein OmpA-like peptidoglycan-associated protein
MKKGIIYNLITIFFCLAISFVSNAQSVDFTNNNFRNNKKGLREAKRNIKLGDEMFALGRGRYIDAIYFYRQANQFNPNNAELNFRIGQCMLFTPEKEQATVFLEKAYSLKPNMDTELLFWIARAHHLTHEFDKAIQKYREFKNTLTPDILTIRGKEVDKFIKECQSGIVLVANPVRVLINNVGAVINTLYPEYSAIINADETMMIFTSRRPNTVGGKRDPIDQKFFEDIYISYRKKGEWQDPIHSGKPLNTKTHDATVGLSADGQTLLIYRGNTRGGDIFECRMKGNSWTKPVRLNKNINTKFHESSASLSPDGTKLFFVSDKPGGIGGHDIYVSELGKNNQWGPAKLLPATINTPYDEEGVFMHADGKTLYFSSKGHNTMGGFDIFKTVYENGVWSIPENLGYPINTADDDVFFSLAANRRSGYYSSAKPGGFGDQDIYVITFLGDEKPIINNSEDNLLAWKTSPLSDDIIEQTIDIQIASLTLFKGRVLDENTKLPLSAELVLYDAETKERVSSFYSNSETGRFLISLTDGRSYEIVVESSGYPKYTEEIYVAKSSGYQEIEKDIFLSKTATDIAISSNTIFKGRTLDAITEQPVEANIVLSDINRNIEITTFKSDKNTGSFSITLMPGNNYSITVEAPGYLFHSENFDIPARAAYQEIEKDIYMNQFAIGTSIVLRNIFFDFDKSTLRTQSISELERLLKLLNDMPNLKIEISGHTDNIGTALYNKGLSERRAKVVVEYLINKGISADRLTYKGYGFDKPIATNTTDEGRQLNRRTEFKIIGN